MKFIALLTFMAAVAAAQVAGYQVSGIVVDHLTNRPLNHVLVELTLAAKGGSTAQVLTEADGRFTFMHVPKGKYNLQAQRRGQNAQGFHATEGGYASAIVVDGKRKTTDLTFALRSDSAISGVVMGDDGDPVRRAQVLLFREGVVDGEAQVSPAGVSATNAEGHFHFGHLEPGKYYLAASGMPWYALPGLNQAENPMVYPVTFYGNTTDCDAARAITVTEGGSTDLQIELHAVPGIHVKVPNARELVMLAVRGPGGSEIHVNAVSTGMMTSGRAFVETNGGRLITPYPQEGAETGSFQLTNFPAGRYQVMTYSPTGDRSPVSQTVDLTDGSTLVLDSNTAPTEVTGRVIFDSPRPDGDLELVLVSGHRRAAMAQVGADGSFKFEKVQPGKFDVNLNSSSLVITSTEAKGAHFLHGHLEIAAGASVALTVHVQSAEALAKIEGNAIKDGAAAVGVMVLLVPQDLQRSREFRRDQSDTDGSFSLTGVQPGRYTLVAIEDGRDVAYKDEKVIRPYLQRGVAITVPLKDDGRVEVPVQARKD